MLNRHCKKFLSFLSQHEADYDNGVYTYDWIEREYPEPIEDVYRMVRFLESEGYVIKSTMNNAPWGIALEEKGKYYKQFYWEEIKASFLKSIFLPVLVALLTYIATQTAGNIWNNKDNLKNSQEPNTETVNETTTAINIQTKISAITDSAK